MDVLLADNRVDELFHLWHIQPNIHSSWKQAETWKRTTVFQSRKPCSISAQDWCLPSCLLNSLRCNSEYMFSDNCLFLVFCVLCNYSSISLSVLSVRASHHCPRANVCHRWRWIIQRHDCCDGVWENMPELVSSDTTQTQPYPRQLPLQVRAPVSIHTVKNTIAWSKC